MKFFKILIINLFFFASSFGVQDYLYETQQFHNIAQEFSHQIFKTDFENLNNEQLKTLAQEIIKNYSQNMDDETDSFNESFESQDSDLEGIGFYQTRNINNKKILDLLCCIKNQLSELTNCNFDPLINLINECCAHIQNIINNLQININTNFNNTFTVLADIKLTLTECCAATQNNFNSTFTVLQDIKNTLTECCESLHNLIASLTGNFTFSVTVEVMFECDLRPSLSAIADLKATLTACCNSNERNFSGTFTVLNDLKLTLTACCAANQTNFNNTFTVLQDIRNTLTACCAQNQTNSNNTFTVLQDIRNTLTACCAANQTNFNGTFTVLRDILNTLTACCQNQNFVDTTTLLEAILQTDTTILSNLNANFCNPIFIRQSDFGPGGTQTYNINDPNLYKLAEDITFNPVTSPNRAISINVPDTALDLQCYNLVQGNTTPLVDGVLVMPNLYDVTIENGSIQSFTRSGISVQQGNVRTLVDNVLTVSCQTRGTEFQGATANPITDSRIKDCTLTRCCQGAAGDFVITFSVCTRCNIFNTKLDRNGISTHPLSVVRLTDSVNCKLNKVRARGNTGSTTVSFDFVNTSSSITKVSSSRTDNALTDGYSGFLLSNNCSVNEFVGCKVRTSTGATTCFGFRITGTQSLSNNITDCLIERNVANTGEMSGIQIDSANRGTIDSNVVQNNRSFGARGIGLHFISPGRQWEIKSNQFLRNQGNTDANSFGVIDPGLNAGTSINLFTNNIAFLNGTVANNQFSTGAASFPAAVIVAGSTTNIPDNTTWRNLRVVD